MGICETCGVSFEPKKHSRSSRYCSGGCYYARGPDGPRKASVKGRRLVTAKGHPLATASGLVARSRLVLYDEIGPGPHQCHWCGRGVAWKAGAEAHHPDALFADHLDWNAENDDPANLVPSCNNCNARRSAPGKRGAIQPDEPVLMVGGNRTRAIEVVCEGCGTPFLTLPSKRRRFCSRSCSHGRYA
jgi:hypothetical protein